MHRALKEIQDAAFLDWDHPFWVVAPFLDYPGTYGPTSYEFEWEREWRIPGGLTFGPSEVAFLFLPADLHDAASRFFDSAAQEGSGPTYRCPLLDPLWSEGEIQDALEAL